MKNFIFILVIGMTGTVANAVELVRDQNEIVQRKLIDKPVQSTEISAKRECKRSGNDWVDGACVRRPKFEH